MKTKLLVLLLGTVFLCNCNKNNPVENNTTSYISATVDGKNYNSKNVTIIRTPLTNDLFSFYAVTPDSLFIGFKLNTTNPAYATGNYSFRTDENQYAILESFIIKDSNSTALVKWTTSQEINLSYFEIDRSADGSDFSPLGNVTSLGNASGATEYTFTDAGNATVQNFYYRLKMVDLDGSVHYSATASYSSPFFDDIAYYREKSIQHKGFNGSIQVTSNDKTRRMVTGKFSFDYTNNSGQAKQVRNGKFTVLY